MIVQGSVKWFDPVKGYGTIECNGGYRAILFRAALRAAGYEAVEEQATVAFEPLQTQGFGVVAGRVLHVLDRGQDAWPRNVPVFREPGLVGTVGWFSRPKGFGFLRIGGEDAVFVHMDTLRACRVRELRQGQAVAFDAAKGLKGRLATFVSLDPAMIAARAAALAHAEGGIDVECELLWADEQRAIAALRINLLCALAAVEGKQLHDAGIRDVAGSALICDLERERLGLTVTRIKRAQTPN